MKNLVFISLCICLFFSSCNKPANCTESRKKPEDLKSVDFDNYNDVSTVYWNYRKFCDEVSRSWQDREFVYNRDNYETNPNPGDFIKVWGWIDEYSLPSTGQFFIHNQIWGDYRRNTLHIFSNMRVGNELALKLVDVDFPAKCFISGEVILPCLEESDCRRVTVSLYLKDVNDIYFE